MYTPHHAALVQPRRPLAVPAEGAGGRAPDALVELHQLARRLAGVLGEGAAGPCASARDSWCGSRRARTSTSRAVDIGSGLWLMSHAQPDCSAVHIQLVQLVSCAFVSRTFTVSVALRTASTVAIAISTITVPVRATTCTRPRSLPIPANRQHSFGYSVRK